ncbi:MAG TPA: hypothetical protein VFH31_05325 [Pyrinomonadaceae bacterium]|nr:hypothetical protein [Pyrinomonadaceae bacterium]
MTTTPIAQGPVDCVVRRKMRQTSDDNYVGDGDYRMQREYGFTPNGNSLGGKWVLRGPEGEWIDFDQYRHDLMARHWFESA